MSAQASEVSTEVVRRLPSAELTHLQQVQMEILREADPNLMMKRLEVWREFKAMQAKDAYVAAFAEFKRNPPNIVKDLRNDQYGSDYTSLGNLVNTTNKALAQHGLNARWDVDQSVAGSIKMVCILSHVEGHQETVTIAGPPDDTGNKNALQRIKSTLTYLEGATFQAITGIVANEFAVNDDGNSAGQQTPGSDSPVAGPVAASSKVPAPPNGYVAWAERLKVKAEEGKDALMKEWKGEGLQGDEAKAAHLEKRTYMVNHDSAKWAGYKRTAEKVTAAAGTTTGVKVP